MKQRRKLLMGYSVSPDSLDFMAFRNGIVWRGFTSLNQAFDVMGFLCDSKSGMPHFFSD